MRKPFYFAQKKCWYVKNSQGRAIRLDPDEKLAYKKWQDMLDVAQAGSPGHEATFSALVEAWMQEHAALIDPVKFDQLASYLTRFSVAVEGKFAKEITKGDLLAWCKAKKPGRLRKDGTRGPSKHWSKTTQGDAARAVKRMFAWAQHEGKLHRNPLASLRVQQGESRLVTISYQQHVQCVTACQMNPTSRPFALYLIASRCGARPRQIREVTIDNVLPGGAAWHFPEHKTSGKTGKPLVVYLSPCLQTLTKILVASRKKFLFVNSDGKPWKKDTVGQNMERLRKRLNIDSVTVYAYRHSFATDALLAGQSLAVVAELLGHTDTRMVGKVYGHLDQQKQHLLDAVAKTAQRRLES